MNECDISASLFVKEGDLSKTTVINVHNSFFIVITMDFDMIF